MLDLERPTYLALPAPISTNHLFVNVPGRGRSMSSEYKAWKKVAAQCLGAQAPLPRYALPVEITLYVGENGVGNMDSDNTAKAYIDALKTARVIHDDSKKWVRSCQPVWVPGMAGCVAMIASARPAPPAIEIIAHIPKNLRELLR